MGTTLVSMFFAAGCLAGFSAPGLAAVAVNADDIGGVVTGPKGPEAGVWVIAETSDLKTRFIKIVVTDDQGRFVIPDLPTATYSIFVRGYGLKDSAKSESKPGGQLNLTVEAEPDAKAAAEIYPANYWHALLKPPAENQFPGTGPQGNGVNPALKTQENWLFWEKFCMSCHQLGTKTTREAAGDNKIEAWETRLNMARDAGDPTMGSQGPRFARTMNSFVTRFGREHSIKMLADWSGGIEKGTLIPEMPPRPQGAERNVVLSLWDWGNERSPHAMIASDKRHPTINAGGSVYGVDSFWGDLLILDPKTSETKNVHIPGLDEGSYTAGHNPVLDGKGRVWISNSDGLVDTRSKDFAFCSDGSTKFSRYFPNPSERGRWAAVYDPKSDKSEIVPVCWTNNHLIFAHDKGESVYFTGDPNIVGWIDTRIWDQTHDAAKAVGWCPMVLDTNGDGKIDPDRNTWNPPQGQAGLAPVVKDPAKDTRIAVQPYGIEVNPVDGSIWFGVEGAGYPAPMTRLDRGSNPPETCKFEYFDAPKLENGQYAAYGPRAADFDSKGIAWVGFSSGQLGRFDRSKCKVLNGPTAIGQHCAEGWTLYDSPGPKMTGTKIGTADMHDSVWVDRFNTLGLGKDVPILPGTNSDSLIAFLPDTKKFVVLRVPYPMSFYARGLDGRIDDAKAGWKGRAIWSSYEQMPLWHAEDGIGGSSKAVKFQMRPDPLAH